MASKQATKRLQKELIAIEKSPPPFIVARPREDDILEWHFIIRGPPDSPYVGGEYHGVLNFPADYPFAPPGIKFLTPSGRFQPDKKICMSMSDFHPGSWNPAWSVSTITTGILSFMLSEELTTGGQRASAQERAILAQRSHDFNLADKRFTSVFPDFCTPSPRDLPNMSAPSTASTTTAPSQPVTFASHPIPHLPGANMVPAAGVAAAAGTAAEQAQKSLSKILLWFAVFGAVMSGLLVLGAVAD